MPEPREKKKQEAPSSETAEQTHASARIDHAFASSDSKKKRTRRLPELSGKQWLLVGLIAAVLIGAGAYAIVRLSDSDTPKQEFTSEGVRLRQLSNDELQKELEKLIFQKKFVSAEQLINYQDNADSYDLRLMLAVTYMNQGEPRDALQVLLDMEQQYPEDWQVAKNIGQMYEQLDNKAKAIKYYQKALNLVKQADDVPVRDDEIFFLEQDIKRLGE